MGRLLDAYKTLVGRSDVQIRAHSQLARIEAEWLEICASVERTMKTLNFSTDALRKREERAAKKAPATTTPAPPVMDPAAAPSPKEALRARLRAEGKMGVPPGRGRGGNGLSAEPQAE